MTDEGLKTLKAEVQRMDAELADLRAEENRIIRTRTALERKRDEVARLHDASLPQKQFTMGCEVVSIETGHHFKVLEEWHGHYLLADWGSDEACLELRFDLLRHVDDPAPIGPIYGETPF